MEKHGISAFIVIDPLHRQSTTVGVFKSQEFQRQIDVEFLRYHIFLSPCISVVNFPLPFSFILLRLITSYLCCFPVTLLYCATLSGRLLLFNINILPVFVLSQEQEYLMCSSHSYKYMEEELCHVWHFNCWHHWCFFLTLCLGPVLIACDWGWRFKGME